MIIYYFGCKNNDPGGAGHFLYAPDSMMMTRSSRVPFPLRENAIDGLFVDPDGKQSVCVLAHIHAQKSWTILQCADYTGDSRPGSNSSLIAEGEWTGAGMAGFWKQHFPEQYARITKAAPLTLAGLNLSDPSYPR